MRFESRMITPLPSPREEFLVDSKVLVRDVTSLKKWTWVELDCLLVPVVFAVFFLKTASISWTKWLISPSRYLAPGSYWIIYDTSRATTLNHSIVMFICLENSLRWKHVVGFPHNKFCLLWSLDGYMKGSFPRVICICNHRVQWVWSITNIQQANCVRDSTYKGKFASRRGLAYVKTRSLSSIVCSQNIHKWQIAICGSSPKCHNNTFISWYIPDTFCNRTSRAQSVTWWICLVLATCATFNKLSAEPCVYNWTCTMDAVPPISLCHLPLNLLWYLV